MSESAFLGFSEHKQKYTGNLRCPDKQGLITRVYSHLKFNHTGILLESGKSYRIEVVGLPERKWKDGSIKPVDGKGWNRKGVKLGYKEIGIAVMEPLRRVTIKGANWFTLCGCIGEDDDNAFVIGNLLKKHVPSSSGELCAFANDLDAYYGNNSGYLEIKVTLL
jgi:hypothetical protein